MEEELTLTLRDQQRLTVLSRWIGGAPTSSESVALLGTSERTAWRLASSAPRGSPPRRTPRPPRYRPRREPMAEAGLLVEVDGSRHDWLEGRGPVLTLIAGIDAATGLVVAAHRR